MLLYGVSYLVSCLNLSKLFSLSMNDSVKLCIYLCGKDLHFYEKPPEFLLKLFYSQFRMTLKIMTASSCTALLCQWVLFSWHVTLSRVTCCLLNQGSLYLSRSWLVMRVMRPQCPDQSKSWPPSLTSYQLFFQYIRLSPFLSTELWMFV